MEMWACSPGGAISHIHRINANYVKNADSAKNLKTSGSTKLAVRFQQMINQSDPIILYSESCSLGGPIHLRSAEIAEIVLNQLNLLRL